MHLWTDVRANALDEGSEWQAERVLPSPVPYKSFGSHPEPHSRALERRLSNSLDASPSPSPSPSSSGGIPNLPPETLLVAANFISQGVTGLPAEQEAVASVVADNAGGSYVAGDVFILATPLDQSNQAGPVNLPSM